MTEREGRFVHDIAVVVPVYQGEMTLEPLVKELATLTECSKSPGGRIFQVVEVVLVHDRGPDRSDLVIRGLADRYGFVRPVWLSRNFGQHPATFAGMASTSASWIVTIDEDGQHNPADIPRLLDEALDRGMPLVYAEATNAPPHGLVRNVASSIVRWLATSVLTSHQLGRYTSYRLIVGELGRAVAAYGGQGVYLDVALSWVVEGAAACPVELRATPDRPSGYNLRRLLGHFLRLVLTAGTRPLRAVTVTGLVAFFVGAILSAYLVYAKVVSNTTVAGWTSVAVGTLLLSGATLCAIGIVAEYVGVAVRMAMGRPPYLIVRDPNDGPLAYRAPVASTTTDAERASEASRVTSAP
jgi:polyisoprenyl-phosphate glycosyltransferase